MRRSSKNVVIVGVSGVPGSFSEEAARTYAGRAGLKRCKMKYLVTVENVLAALEEGSVGLGVFPIENSNGGIVVEAVYAMAKHRFHIKKIFEIEVVMNLLAKKGANPQQIKKITSHDQALKQCRQYLKRRWPAVKVAEYPDTAKAAQDLAAGVLSADTAVVASRAAAKRYKLAVLEEGIQDLKFNYTSFIAACSEPGRKAK